MSCDAAVPGNGHAHADDAALNARANQAVAAMNDTLPWEAKIACK